MWGMRSRAAWTAALWSLVALMALPGPAGAESSGKALGVTPQAQAERAADVLLLSVGADVFIGDRIVTSDRGLVQIQFSDGTKLVVGPNSAMVLEDYLVRADASAGKFAIDALSGTFRFVTGDAPKDSYLITTPTGTMGVRGTAFDFYVEPEQTSVLSYHGSVILCAVRAACVTLSARCEIGVVQTRASEVLGRGREARGIDAEFFNQAFRYAQSQRELQSRFRISNATSCSRQFERIVAAQQQRVAEVPPVDPPPVDPPPVTPPPKPPKLHDPHGHPNHDHPKHPNEPHEHKGGGPGKPDKSDKPGKPEKKAKKKD